MIDLLVEISETVDWLRSKRGTLQSICEDHDMEQIAYEQDIISARELLRTITEKETKQVKNIFEAYRELKELEERFSRREVQYRGKRKLKNVTKDEVWKLGFDEEDVSIYDSICDDVNYLVQTYNSCCQLMERSSLGSSTLVQDFESFLITKNTVEYLINYIEELFPGGEDGALSEAQQFSQEQSLKMEEEYQNNVAEIEERFTNSLQEYTDNFASELGLNVSAAFIEECRRLCSGGELDLSSPNGMNSTPEDVVYKGYLYYPFCVCNNDAVNEYIEKYFYPLVDHNCIVFPIVFSGEEDLIINLLDYRTEGGLRFIQSVVFSLLANIPVGKCSIDILDNRGTVANSSYIQRLAERIDGVVNLYSDADSIKKYIENGNAEADSREEGITRLLIVTDSLSGMNEEQRTWSNNQLAVDPSEGNCLLSISKSNNLNYDPTVLTIISEEFDVTFGDCILRTSEPLSEDQIDAFADAYIFLHGSEKSIAAEDLIKRLATAETPDEAARGIQMITELQNQYDNRLSLPKQGEKEFPKLVPVGRAIYPSGVFNKSKHKEQIMDILGLKDGVYSDHFVLPLMYEPEKSFNLILRQDKENKDAVVRLTQNLILNLLSGIPVTKLNISIFDPVDRGNSVMPFLEFKKNNPNIFDSEICTTSEQIMQKLKALSEYIDNFIQEKLGSAFSDFYDYNVNNPMKQESVKLLIWYDFPTCINSESIDLLQNIVNYAGKCGVITLFCYDPDLRAHNEYQAKEIDAKVNDLIQLCTEIDCANGESRIKQNNTPIDIGVLPSDEMLAGFFEKYSAASEIISNQGLSFSDIMAGQRFSMDSGRQLSIPIGIGDGSRIVNLDLGEGSSHHGLIVGATGSGKSTLLHTIIMSGMLNYAPDQLQLYLMDFKSGTEFKIYESFHLPHIRLLALDAMQEFGESILESIVEEMEQRSRLFKNAGQTSLRGYKEATGASMPRILVLMDEFQILFNTNSNGKVAKHCAELAKRIVTEGRAFGINLIMATQTTRVILDLSLDLGVIEQMRVRIGMKCGESDARYMFSAAEESQVLELMKGPIGTAVINQDYTEKQNQGFRVAYCDPEEQHRCLELISDEFKSEPCRRQVFEGQRTPLLMDHINRIKAVGDNNALRTVTAYLGEPIKVAEPISITMSKKNRHNLLICGANERMESILIKDFIITVMMSLHIDLYYMDGSILVDDYDMDDYLQGAYSNRGNIHLAQGRADIISYINTLYETYQEQKKNGSRINTVVVINNLQYIDIIQAMLRGEQVDESEYTDTEENAIDTLDTENPFDQFGDLGSMGSSEKTIGEKLIQMIENGYAYGIHFVIASADYQVVMECLRNWNGPILNRFPERIIFSLDSNAAESLIPDISLDGMRENIVVYTDGIKQKYQMKPFMPPNEEELAGYLRG